jgi:YVTN family beta-propeller protein
MSPARRVIAPAIFVCAMFLLPSGSLLSHANADLPKTTPGTSAPSHIKARSFATELVRLGVNDSAVPQGREKTSLSEPSLVGTPDPPPSLTTSIGTGAGPTSGVFDAANGYVYVSNWNSSSVTIIDGTSVVATVPVGAIPNVAAVDARNGWVYVPNWGSNNVSVISGTKIIASLAVGSAPDTATYDGANGFVYVTNFNSSNVSVISGDVVVGSVDINHNPDFAAYDSDNGYTYVLCIGNGTNTGTLSAINGTRVVSTLLVGTPLDVGYDNFNGLVYVSNIGNGVLGGQVLIVNGTTLIGVVYTGLSLGINPSEFAFDSEDGLVYLANSYTNNVSVIDGTTLIGTVQVGARPVSATYDSNNGFVFVANAGSSNVSIIDGLQVVRTVPVGDSPWSATFDPADDYVYVTNSNSSNVSAIYPEFGVTFNESGLPHGKSWQVALSGMVQSSNSAFLAFAEPAGTYLYTVAYVAPFFPSPLNGTVTVAGSNQNIPVAYSVVYLVNFTETGLPAGTTWSVTMKTAGGPILGLSQGLMVFFLRNGTYSYTLGTIPGWTTSNFIGVIAVNGSGLSRVVSWTQVTYDVTFEEVGLPSETNWTVTLNGTERAGTAAILFPGVPNGTYLFTVGVQRLFVPVPESGNITVDGAPRAVNVTYNSVVRPGVPIQTPSTSPLTFLGLPAAEGYALLGGIAAAVVAVAVGVVVWRRRGRRTPSDVSPLTSSEPPAT